MIFVFLVFAIYFPIDSWQNEVLEEIQVRGYYFTKFPSIRPYLLSLNKDLPCPCDSATKCSCTIYGAKELYRYLWLPNLSLNLKFDTIKVARLKPMVNYDFSGISLYLQPDVKLGTDSLPPYKVFKNLFAADYERVYVQYQNKAVRLFIGRERFSIGPSPRYNMILSGYGPPLDWFHYSFSAKYIQLSYYLSQLDDMVCKPFEYTGDTISTLINARRYLIIKRLDWTPIRWFNCSFSEAATFGGEDYTLMPYHFNPIVFIHTLQHNWEKDANLFFHLDFRLFLKKFSVYAALLVDDYQLEPDPNNEPNHFGFNWGVEFVDLFIPRNFFIIEYHLLSRWIYCIYAPYQRYMYYRQPIGFPYGPDCDELYTKYVYHLNEKFDLYLGGTYLRKGENSVNSIWPIPENPRIPGTSFPEDNFLSGTVENILNIKLGVRFFYHKFLGLEFSMGYLNIQNHHHHIGTTKNLIQLNMVFNLLNLN